MNPRYVLSALLPLLLIALMSESAEKKSGHLTPTDAVIPILTGKDLSCLTPWMNDTTRQDPRKVFSVKDGMIRVSGDGTGYLATDREYRDYHLVVEYKWG